MEIDKKAVGQKIRLIRQAKGMTLKEFGQLFEASKGNVSLWESGSSLPSNERIKKMAEIANIPVEELLYEDMNLKISVDTFLYDQLTKYLDKRVEIMQREEQLTVALTVDPTFSKKFKEIEQTKENITDRGLIAYLHETGMNYIKDNFDQYTYEVYTNDFPNSDAADFQQFKEKKWGLLRMLIAGLWDSYSFSAKGSIHHWINERFIKEVKEDLESIMELAIQENKEDYYINEVIQSILDEAAKKIKEINPNNATDN